MGDKAKAQEAKARGNAAFQAKDFGEAIKHFSEAIDHDPTDHVFFSNRSACYASLEKYDEALEDGKKCVELKHDWPKGYTRKGLAEFFLERYDDAAETYKAGLKLAPEDAAMKEGLQKAMDAKYEVPGAGARVGRGGGSAGIGAVDPTMLAVAAARNPRIRGYLQDKALMQKINMLMSASSGPESVQQQLVMELVKQDPRVLEVFLALQGMDVRTVDPESGAAFVATESGTGEPPLKKRKEEPAKEEPRKEEGNKEEKKEEPKKDAAAEDAKTTKQNEAEEFKKKGNELYKKKKFEEALEMYDKAIEKEPNDLTYFNNKCAAWIEMGDAQFDKVLETCNDLVNRRYEINTANPGGASFEKVAKVLARMASVHERRRQYDEAIELYKKSLTEDNSRFTRNALREAERAKEKYEKEAYIDPAQAEQHREKGNEFFKEQKWADAKKEYDEAVRRNPKDAKLYSNRAAALTKLLAYPDALRDLDECLKLDPNFVKAYSRKGAAHFFMKEYHKALQAYEEGLKLEPNNDECHRGREQVMNKIAETSSSREVDEEQLRHAMADPEIQRILRDPHIEMFLKTMKENPMEANKALRSDAKLKEAVSKLVAAGVLRIA